VADETVPRSTPTATTWTWGGVAVGSTTVVFRVLHGSHSDYDSPAIPIAVTP
jgi:hypothetical protein